MKYKYFSCNLLGVPGPPEAPLVIQEVNHTDVTIRWKPPLYTGGLELTGYYIERRDTNYVSWIKVDRVQPSITTYCVQNLYEDSEYMFRVCAENREGRSIPITSEAVMLGKPPGSSQTNDYFCSSLPCRYPGSSNSLLRCFCRNIIFLCLFSLFYISYFALHLRFRSVDEILIFFI